MDTTWTLIEREMSNAIRFLSADAVQEAGSGHPGMPLGAADLATALFARHLKFSPGNPAWPDRDRFVLSAGHGSMLLYAVLFLIGYSDMTLDELRRLRKRGARTAGHPEYGHASGIEATTGPLGQGLAMAVGMALAERMQNARFGNHIVDHHTYALAGDGCLMEGVAQEAISLAGHLRLSKLIVLFDDNSVSIDGPTSVSVSEDHLTRFKAAGWSVSNVDGHDLAAISSAISLAKGSDRPSFVACKTIIGYGAPTKAGTSGAHSSPLGIEELAAARAALGWSHGNFEVPPEVLGAWRTTGARGHSAFQAWQARLAAEPASIRDLFADTRGDVLSTKWQAALVDLKVKFAADRPRWPTRQASGEVLKVLTTHVPQLIGGSADLTEAVYSQTANLASISPEDFRGRHIHYGVREHAMAAVMNGIALHGYFIPYGGTFLVFSDYMRGAMRLSALMRLHVIYVLTHDSIGLGEDGPTHQAVETLSGLRALPNFKVFRPCDPIETAECWELALGDVDGPSGIALSRQVVPMLRDVPVAENLSARGGYVLNCTSADPDVTIIATGSEVQIALAAQSMLKALCVSSKVVSMPCWELFDEQPDTYRRSVLGSNVLKVGIEAGVRHGWDKYIGPDGLFFGMTGFGASGPAEELFELYGITADRVVEAVLHRRTAATVDVE